MNSEILLESLIRMGAMNAIKIHRLSGLLGSIAISVDSIKTVVEGSNIKPLTDHQRTSFILRETEFIQRQLIGVSSLLEKSLPSLGATESILINRFAENCIDDFRSRHQYLDQIELFLELQADSHLVVEANPQWLQDVLEILLDNALRAISTEMNGKVIVATGESGGFVEITVQDNGAGIPDVIAQQIFEEPIHSEDKESLGIGLILARFIIEKYGGEIHLKSTGPGGTTMAIRLPQK